MVQITKWRTRAGQLELFVGLELGAVIPRQSKGAMQGPRSKVPEGPSESCLEDSPSKAALVFVKRRMKMMGVAMNGRCPDQSVYETQRKASVAAALYDPPSPVVAKVKKSTKGQATKQSRGGLADRVGGR